MQKKCAEIFGKQKQGLLTGAAKKEYGICRIVNIKKRRKNVLSEGDIQNTDSAIKERPDIATEEIIKKF